MKTTSSARTLAAIALTLSASVGPVCAQLAPAPGAFPGGPPTGAPAGGTLTLKPTVLDVPVEALEYALKLNREQKQKIAAIQAQFQEQRMSLLPRPDPQAGRPPDFSQFQAAQERIRTLERQAERRIQEVLTAQQRSALPETLEEIELLHGVGLPAELLGDLKLTAEQKAALARVGQQSQQAMRRAMEAGARRRDFNAGVAAAERARAEMRQKVLAVLTAPQRRMVEEYQRAHPEPVLRSPGAGPGGFILPGGPGGPGPF